MTGAGGALGGATLRVLRRAGVSALGLDLRAADGVLACDVTDDDQVKRVVEEAVDQLGGLDILVHFAGVGIPVDIGAPPDQVVRRTLDVNLLGTWRVTAHALPALVRAKGRVVIVASGLAYVTLPLSGAYTVSKRALTAYADTLRAEYGTHVSVTTIYPGFVDTPIHEPSRDVGVSLDGTFPPEGVDDVVRTVMRALTARRPPRDRATTPLGRAGVTLARHLPALADAGIKRQLTRQLRSGRFADAPLASGLRQRFLEGFLEGSPGAPPRRQA